MVKPSFNVLVICYQISGVTNRLICVHCIFNQVGWGEGGFMAVAARVYFVIEN